MPDVSESPSGQLPRNVDTHLFRQSTQGWATLCSCGRGVKSEIYDQCRYCSESIGTLDAKPGVSSIWNPTGRIPAAPFSQSAVASASAVAQLKRVNGGSSSSGSSDAFAQRDATRLHDHAAPVLALPQRGRPPNGSNRPGHLIGFKGVRQRRNVRGYLVEIRPPRWKKTIWLGTYNTGAEAAGAYDAGVFYTKKRTRYNFPQLDGTFPPLPSHLALDCEADADDIKLFVQREAQKAAAKVKGLGHAATSACRRAASSSHFAHHDDDLDPKPAMGMGMALRAPPGGGSPNSSEDSQPPSAGDSELDIPNFDFPWLEHHYGTCNGPAAVFSELEHEQSNMLYEYLSYNQQLGAPPMWSSAPALQLAGFELKQEMTSFQVAGGMVGPGLDVGFRYQ